MYKKVWNMFLVIGLITCSMYIKSADSAEDLESDFDQEEISENETTIPSSTESVVQPVVTPAASVETPALVPVVPPAVVTPVAPESIQPVATPTLAPVPTVPVVPVVAPAAPAVVATPVAPVVPIVSNPINSTIPKLDLEKIETGIDSLEMNDASGNWLLKRGWFEKSEDVYDKIINGAEEAHQQRLLFSNKRDDLEAKLLTPFYNSIGIDQGTLNTVLENLIEEVNQIRKKTVVLSEQEREFLELVSAEQKSLDQLKDDISSIEKIDAKVDEAVEISMEIISLIRKYEREAWGYLQSITKELSDKNARVLHSKIVTAGDNIRLNSQYLKGEFTKYFDSLISIAKANTDRVKDTMEKLKEKGIDLKKRGQTLKDVAAQSEEKEAEIEKEIEEEEIEEAMEQESWSARISSAGYYLVSLMRDFLEGVIDLGQSAYQSVAQLFSGKVAEVPTKSEKTPTKAIAAQ